MLGKGHYSKAFFQCSLLLLTLSHLLKKDSNKVTHYFSDKQILYGEFLFAKFQYVMH